MTPELYSLMRRWLETGDEHQKRHAEHRLSMPDAAAFDPSSIPARPIPLKTIPPVIHDDPWRLKILACEHYQPGCCSHPAPYCTRFLISPSREQCIECLGTER